MMSRRIPLAVVLTAFALFVLIPRLPAHAQVCLTDMAGRRVVSKGKVNRIVATFKPAAIMAYCLGLSRQMVGMNNGSCKSPLLNAVFPGTREIAGVGQRATGLNLETIVGLKPDLVVLYAQKDGLDTAGRLARLKIPAIVIIPESFESIKTAVRLLGRAAGKEERGVTIAREMDEILALTTRGLAGLAEKKNGYFASPTGLFSTATGAMLQDRIMAAAGVRNVAEDLNGFYQKISPEQLVLWNPDMIILSRYLPQEALTGLAAPPMAGVSAISNRYIYRCPDSLAPWDYPSPLSVLATLWLAHKAYPHRFSDLDMDAVVDRFYVRLLGKGLSTMGGQFNDKVDF